MAATIRKYTLIITISILYSIFVFSLANAFIPEHTYPDMCDNDRDMYPFLEVNECEDLAPPEKAQIDACPGDLRPDYSRGCAIGYVCDCWELREANEEKDTTIVFWFALIFGGLAVIAGMLLPQGKEINEWIGGGLILGGIITLFLATLMHWDALHKIARPVIILVELVLIIWIAYRKFDTGSKKKR